MDNERHSFLSYVRRSVGRPDECWPWKGYVRPDGYPMIGSRMAYRAVYELLMAPVPDGLELDHTCRNPLCVNPNHLEPVPQVVNNMRSDSPAAAAARKTHCKNGHAFNAENTYYRKGPRGPQRMCRACRRDGMRRAAAG